MTTPDSLKYVALRAQFPSGVTGKITLTSRQRIQSPGDNYFAGPFHYTVELDELCYAEVSVVATDSPGWTPSGWTYRVKEALSSGVRTYDIAVPNAAPGGVLWLPDVSPVDEAPGVVTYVLAENVAVPGGLATLGEDGLLSEDQRPAGSGGGAVDSVNGETGVVVLDAADVGAAPTSHTHSIANVTGLQGALDGKAASAHTHDDRYYTEVELDIAFDEVDTLLAGKANTSHTHAIADTTGLQAALDGKAASSHTHSIANVTGLQTTLDGKSDTSHNHDTRYYTETETDTLLAGKSNTGHTHPGGSTLTVVQKLIETGNTVAPSTGGGWNILPQYSVSIPAAVGDYVELLFELMAQPGTSMFLDWAVVKSSDTVIARANSSNSATPKTEGSQSLYSTPSTFRTAPNPFAFVVEAGDLDGGNVKFALIVKASGTGTIYGDTTYNMELIAKNYGAISYTRL